MLRLKIVMSFHCLVATWNLGRDLIISFLSEIYVATLKICRDFNSTPPVATSLLGHNILNYTTYSYCHDINSRSRPWLGSPTYNFVATWNCLGETLKVHSTLLFGRNLKTVSRHYLPCSSSCLSLIKFSYVATIFVCLAITFGHDLDSLS